MVKKTIAKKTGTLIFGINPLIELLKAKRVKLISIYTTKPTPKAWNKIEKLLPKRPVPIQYVARDVLTKMVDTTDHQGIVAWIQPFPIRKKPFDPKKQRFLLLLDGIQDPRNLGAILRSAYCTGVEGVLITKKGSAPLNAVAIKASAGLAFHLEIYNVPSAQSAVQELKKSGYQLYITSFNGKNAATCTYQQPLCVVIGSEGMGVSQGILKSGTQITLPQRSEDISYNASVAAGIILFTIGVQINRI